MIFVVATSALASEIPSNAAEAPIVGGLGLRFLEAVGPSRLGAEVDRVPGSQLPDNRAESSIPSIPPGARQPWRYFADPQLPRPFRHRESKSFVMLDDADKPVRILSHIQQKGCGEDFEWLKTTLRKKYEVKKELKIAELAGNGKHLRLVFSDRQIDVSCGERLTLDYGDYKALSRWSKLQEQRTTAYERERQALDKRRMVLETGRALRFADTFTLGDRYRLMGGFGVAFKQPFAKNSTQVFPVDTPFIAMLPALEEPFDAGEIILEISPDKEPITIRGRFRDVAFESLAAALKAKYGAPMKASNRHVIHKVSGNHAILKRLDSRTVEVAFIDTKAQSEQRQRKWQQESEGL